MAVISVDAGTTMIKAVGYDDSGAEAVIVRQATAVTHPHPGWAEQDMDSVWDAVAAGIRAVAVQLPPGSVDVVTTTAQGDGSWLVDAGGRPTGPAVLWNDARAADQIAQWARAGVLDRAFALNGSLTSAGLPNGVLSWLRRFDPARLDASHLSLSCNGWIFAQLTGELACDESDGSAPFMDIRSRRYSDELLELYGLAWARELLPELRTDHQRLAQLSERAAEQTGLPAGTAVVMAPYDIAATAIGVGAVDPGQACAILGTTICTEVVAGEVRLGDHPAGITVALGVPGRYLRAFPTLAGGEVIQWVCGLLGLRDPLELGELARGIAPGAAGLNLLPYLSPAGERAPFLDPQARGSLLGMTFNHGREHLARAVFDGLSMVIGECLLASGSTPSEIGVCGGGASSPVWLQTIADVTGVPVLRSTDAEAGARGAYLVALAATGAATDVPAAAAAQVRIRDRFEPDADNHERYGELYEGWLDLRRTTAPAWARLAAMRSSAFSSSSSYSSDKAQP